MYGYEEPPNIRPGKISLRSALDILSKHEADPGVNKAEALAKEYSLDLVVVNDIVSHFRTLDVIMPTKEPKDTPKNPLRLLQQKMDQIRD
jgi:hypothetical protein